VKLLVSLAEALRHTETGEDQVLKPVDEVPLFKQYLWLESFGELLAKPVDLTDEGLISAARLLAKFPHIPVKVQSVDWALSTVLTGKL